MCWCLYVSSCPVSSVLLQTELFVDLLWAHFPQTQHFLRRRRAPPETGIICRLYHFVPTLPLWHHHWETALVAVYKGGLALGGWWCSVWSSLRPFLLWAETKDKAIHSHYCFNLNFLGLRWCLMYIWPHYNWTIFLSMQQVSRETCCKHGRATGGNSQS